MRFCITCGSPLTVPPPAPVAASPVVSVAKPAAPVETRTCKRCQGTSDKNAQFCRFCGASLNETTHSNMPIPLSIPKPAEQPSQPRLDATLVTAQSPVDLPKPEVDTGTPQGRLVVVHKDGGEGESFPLRDQLDVGREAGECVFADDRYMAPRHARLTRKDGSLFLRDLGTPNGLYIRLRKDEQNGVLLEDQDLILLGQQVLRFEVVKDAEAGFGGASEQGTLVFGTPAAPRYARLSQRTTEGVSCDVFHVRKPETILGRESGDVVFPDDPFMSRRHASVRVSEAPARTFRLADLGSSNGTFVRIRGEISLQHGDEFRIGQQLLRVDLRGPQV
jgi:pSer/pThr/pTyr-binding forkhead associated (FHA) protein